MLVHPKDKISDEEKPEVVYKMPCKNWKRAYIAETGRPLWARVKEHNKEVDSIMPNFIQIATILNSTKNVIFGCQWPLYGSVYVCIK